MRMRTLLTLVVSGLVSLACSAGAPKDEGSHADVNAPTVEASSIATEFEREGFVVDTQRPATQQDALGEQLSGTFYKHSDGRAALLVRAAANELGGEIYDPAGKILQQLKARKAATIHTQDDSCVYSGIYWNDSTTYTVEISSCSGGSGTYCWATCDTSGSCNSQGSGCISTSCGCAMAE